LKSPERWPKPSNDEKEKKKIEKKERKVYNLYRTVVYIVIYCTFQKCVLQKKVSVSL
jgi:hypothetical protein